jgi:hypothetical protein
MLKNNSTDKVLSPIARVASCPGEELCEDFGPGTSLVVEGSVEIWEEGGVPES